MGFKFLPASIPGFKATREPMIYSRVWSDDKVEKSSSASDSDTAESQLPQSQSILQHSLWLPSLAVLQGFAILALVVYISTGRKSSDLACATQLSPYSPYLESGNLEYEEFTDQNHLMQPSPYRGHPTPEVEGAWLKLWRLPMIHFPEDKMEALNKTPADLYTHASPKFGGGVLGYLNVFHQLHCLNLVRQYTYRNEYDYSNVSAFKAPEALVRGHVDHCIETIRKAIMCTSDVTPVVFKKDPSRPSGRNSDFNLRRKCRNFQRIQEWALVNRADQ